MLHLIHRHRAAMATRFEIWLLGEDEEHLAALADAALEEVARVEQVLSRHDPRSELARVNREARGGDVLVTAELAWVLGVCLDAAETTEGWFDVVAAARPTAASDTIAPPRDAPPRGHATWADVALDREARRVRYLRDDVTIDLGGVGKGYALDQIDAVLRGFPFASALAHGGTSSVRAWGRGPEGRGWPVDLRPLEAPADAAAPPSLADTVPSATPAANPAPRLWLADRALSVSAAFHSAATSSDLIDPHSGRPLDEQRACIVLAPTATEAELLSTALVAMGRARAEAYTQRRLAPEAAVGWIDAEVPAQVPVWLRGESGA